MLNSDTFYFSLKENWSDSVDTLRSLSCLILCWNEEEKHFRSFVHPNLSRVSNHDQAVMLKHTLAKLSRTGTLIGQKCPKIEVNSQVDSRFTCKRNLCGKKSPISKHLSVAYLSVTYPLRCVDVAYFPYDCNNCTIKITYYRFKEVKANSMNCTCIFLQYTAQKKLAKPQKVSW